MCEAKRDKSDSDLSTGSWTILDEEGDQGGPDVTPEDPLKTQDPCQREECCENRDKPGPITLEQFLEDGMIEHDYVYDDKLYAKLHRKQMQRDRRRLAKRCRAHLWGISVFLGIMLTLTAVTTLCSHYSQRRTPKHTPTVPPQLNRGAEPGKAQLLQSIDRTIREIDRIHAQTLAKVVHNASGQCNTVTPPRQIFGNTTAKPQAVTPKPQPQLPAHKPQEVARPRIRTTRSRWTVVRDVLLDSNVHALVSLVMTNVYLFTLLTDLTRRANGTVARRPVALDDLQAMSGPQEVRRYLFGELPFSGLPASCRSRQDVPVASLESGKSECEKRFAELDACQRGFDQLKRTQRDRIRLLKAKYRNEISYIRDTEEESDARADRINRTSRRFMRRLKFNREQYLGELRKMRRNKQDAATNSYAVVIPSVYRFGANGDD